ncbi:FecR domain-containing protein [Massilibacteroides sp.]|uniref:FecR family protein n=1 Tax=Massilibacteroides sp. TaxID=2034766 RepID=UPI00261099A8|nr:FecR domain-containing protein [Massilibacteroides sp.]MDD4516604.1 FecR domain-containing protein [Massilibacteroides sp.]
MNVDEEKIELLFNYFTGALSKEEEKDLLKWLKERDENARLFSKMQDWWAIVHIPLFKSDLEADFKEYFRHLEQASVSTPKKQKTKRFIFWRNIAAVLFSVVVVGISAYYVSRLTFQKDVMVSMIETSTQYGMQSKVILPDSSAVFLNSGSLLRYRSDFATNRNIELEGEAYFEVKQDLSKPFTVSSGNMSVKVKGTTFNVQAYHDEETMDIVLLTGRVDVEFQDHPDQKVLLSPNQQLSYNKSTDQTNIKQVRATDAILWTKGYLFFSEKTFPEIARMLERRYNMEIVIQSSVLQKEVFSGSFSSRYSLNDIIKEIDVEGKYQWVYKNEKLIITDK